MIVFTRPPIPVSGSDFVSIDHVELQFLLNDLFLDMSGEVCPILHPDRIQAVQQECSAWHRILQHIVLFKKEPLMARDEICLD